jgi:Tfp pilus assembly protein PilV
VIKNKISFMLRDSREAGLSLVEVVVAIALIMIIATASASLSIQALNSASSQERRQLAITVANTALETVAAQQITDLYDGRGSTAVTNAQTASVNFSGVKQTYRGVDTAAAAASNGNIPISATTIQSGTTFTVKTLIGPCYLKINQPQNTDCTVAPGYAYTTTGPTTEPSGYSAMIRTIVIVTWTAGKTCGVTPCSYTASTLIDPHIDPVWILP